ncbi:MAG: DMT family transporter [Pseudomonadota bacterium]
MTPPAHGPAHRSGIPLMLVAMFCIAANDAVGKELTQTYSIWQVLWIRSWIWVAFALVWIATHGGFHRAIRSRKPGLQTIRSLILVAEITVFVLAFKHLPLADVTAVSAGTPLVVLVLAVIFLNERVGAHRWTAVALGFVGILLITRPGLSVFGTLTLLPVAGIVLWGVYQVLMRFVSAFDSTETTLLWSGVTIFVVTGAVAPWFWISVPDWETWALFALVGSLNTAGHFMMIAAIARSEASALQPFTYSIVLWALLLGWLVFDEWPDAMSVAGTLLVLAGGLYALHRERRQARATHP